MNRKYTTLSLIAVLIFGCALITVAKGKTEKPIELFNQKTDISETKNLAPSMLVKVKELKTLLNNWQDETDAKFPTPNPNYKNNKPL